MKKYKSIKWKKSGFLTQVMYPGLFTNFSVFQRKKKLHAKQPIDDISKSDLILNLENLVPGSAYQVQFSVVLFEGMA